MQVVFREKTRGEPGGDPERWAIEELPIDGKGDISQLWPNMGQLSCMSQQRKSRWKQLKSPCWSCGGSWKTLHILNFGWDDTHEADLQESVQNAVEATAAFYG